ncbi:hypothetical protein Tco_0008815 [Tanacetum coccineum]
MVKIHTDTNVVDLLTKAFINGIGVNAGDSKLMLLGINLLLLGKVNVARHKLTAVGESINLLLLLKVNATRHNLQLLVNVNAVEGMDCLPNATIFKELTKMGFKKLLQKLTFYKAFFSPQWKFLIHTILQCLSAKTTAWNEFSSSMDSAIICLATNQKFNFSKYIFESMVKNLDNVGKFLMYPRSRRPKRKDTEVPQPSGPIDNVADEIVNEEMDDSLERAATTATSLDAEQDRGNINKTQSKATPNEPSFLGTSSGGGPMRQETIGKTIAKNSPSSKDYTRLERKIDDIDKDAEITLVDETHGRYGDKDMFRVHDLDGDEVVVKSEVNDKASEKRNIV